MLFCVYLKTENHETDIYSMPSALNDIKFKFQTSEVSTFFFPFSICSIFINDQNIPKP